MKPLVGVLALQGDFEEHRAALTRAGLASREVRAPRDLAGVSALVLPGGESTTMLRLLVLEGMFEPLRQAVGSGMPVLATCAGLILLAAEVTDPAQRSLGVLDIAVQRNGYGRQYYSGTFELESACLPPHTSGVFIRAPRILHSGPEVEVLARRGPDPVLVRAGAVFGACFHPELQPDHPVTSLFVDAVRGIDTPCRAEPQS